MPTNSCHSMYIAYEQALRCALGAVGEVRESSPDHPRKCSDSGEGAKRSEHEKSEEQWNTTKTKTRDNGTQLRSTPENPQKTWNKGLI